MLQESERLSRYGAQAKTLGIEPKDMTAWSMTTTRANKLGAVRDASVYDSAFTHSAIRERFCSQPVGRPKGRVWLKPENLLIERS